MNINITSRHFKANDEIQTYVRERLESLTKYHEEIIHADAILDQLTNSNNNCTCELIVKLKNKLLTTKTATEDFVKSIDQSVDVIEKQILKHKDKVKKDKHNTDKEKINTI